MITHRRSATRASALALALLLAHPATSLLAAADLSPQDSAVLKKIDGHYNHLHALRAAFTETYDGLGLHKAETGSLLLSKPGRMRWSYTDPPGKTFILDGTYAWSYSPGDAQAQRVPAKQLDDQRSPLRFLLGHTQLASELVGIHVSSTAEGSTVTGIPRGQEQRLKLLTVQTDPAGSIQRLRLEEIDGSVTEFRFSALQENPPVTPADFYFVPPAGVPVVDGLPPI